MNLRVFLITLATALLPIAAAAQTVVPPNTYPGGASPAVFSATGDVTTTPNTITVNAGATVTFHSTTKISLEPGFHVLPGGNFYAMIGPVVDTDGDGLPDAWERAHGLDPNNSADAQSINPTSGLSYLIEYQLSRTTSIAKQDDANNLTNLKINRPAQ